MSTYQLAAFADEADKLFQGQIRALKAHNIGLLEVRGVNGKNMADLTDNEAKDVAMRLADTGLALSSLGSPYGKYAINEPFETHLTTFRRGLELCDLLGCRRVRMFSFFMPKGDEAANWRGKVIDQLGQMLELAEQAHVKLVHENEKGIYGDTFERVLDLMEQFGGRLGCAFDPANFVQCGVKPGEAIGRLKPYVTYLHIKDALLDGGAIVPAGMGDGDVAAVLEAMSDRADDMTLTIEPHLKVFDGLQNLQGEVITNKYHYPDSAAAFAAATDALKTVLGEIGYQEQKGGNGKWTR